MFELLPVLFITFLSISSSIQVEEEAELFSIEGATALHMESCGSKDLEEDLYGYSLEEEGVFFESLLLMSTNEYGNKCTTLYESYTESYEADGTKMTSTLNEVIINDDRRPTRGIYVESWEEVRDEFVIN